MRTEDLDALINDAVAKGKVLRPEVSTHWTAWGNVVGNLTRDAKTPAEYDAILAEHSDQVVPLRDAMLSARYERAVQNITFHRAITESTRRHGGHRPMILTHEMFEKIKSRDMIPPSNKVGDKVPRNITEGR